jgi:hypothetical protein
VGTERCTSRGQRGRTGDDTPVPWGHPVGGKKVQKSLVPRPCAPGHRALNIHQPEGTTNHPGGNSRSREGPGDRTIAGGTTRAAGGRTGGRGQLARAGAGHGAASRRTATADSAAGKDGATRPRRTRRSPAPTPSGNGPRSRAAARPAGTRVRGHRAGHPQGQAATGPQGHRTGQPRGTPAPELRNRSAGHPQGQPARRVRTDSEGQDTGARPQGRAEGFGAPGPSRGPLHLIHAGGLVLFSGLSCPPAGCATREVR